MIIKYQYRAPHEVLKRSVEMRAQKQMVTVNEKLRNLRRLRAAEDALADAVLDDFYFQYLGNPC